MGWFDNEQDPNTPNAAPPQPVPTRPVARAAPSTPESGSTLGRKIHVDGAIVCDEDLTILGRVEGTIRAKGTLVIAKEADVQAKIDGQRVLVHGKVDGNVEGAEQVVIGQTGKLNGNIQAPSLEILEGAYFKGSVEMQPPASRKSEAAKEPSKPTTQVKSSGTAAPTADTGKGTPVAGAAAKGSSPQKQATT